MSILNHKLKLKTWFTLVELIVVISILAILWTIAFLSFSWYSSSSRDSVRISDIANISKWLELYKVNSWKYPLPESPATITLSWNIISLQWYLWDNQSSIIKISKTPVDPLDQTKYIYSTDSNQISYKLLYYLEKQTALNSSFPLPLGEGLGVRVYAIDYTTRIPRVTSKWPAILVDYTTNIPVSINTELNNNTNSYKAIIDNSNSITWSGIEIAWGLQALALKWWDLSQPKTCPTWFIPVPGNAEFSQPGFCVAKYKMALERDLTTSELSPANFNTWTWSTTTRWTWTIWIDWTIVSAPWKYQIANITQIQAMAACKSIWWHLITNNEWMTVARNIEAQSSNWSTWIVGSWGIYRWVVNLNDSLWCDAKWWNIETYPYATKTWPSTTSTWILCNPKRQLKLSNWEIIWDLAWNIWEYVNKANTNDWINYNSNDFKSWVACNWANGWYAFSNWEITPPTLWTCNYINWYSYSNNWPKILNLNTDNGIWRIYSFNTPNNVWIRWGTSNLNSSPYSGIFTLNLRWSETSWHPSVGFRCSY